MGGAETSLLILLSRLDLATFEPYVIVPDYGSLVKEIEKLQIPCFIKFISQWIPYKKKWGLLHFREFLGSLRSRAWAIATIIEKHFIDIVYTNTVTCIDGAVAAYITKKPHIWHIREHIKGNRSLKSYLPNTWVPWIVAALSNHVVVNSRNMYKYFETKMSQGKITLIYNGVDLERFTISSNTNEYFRNELGINMKTKIVLIVGTLIPAKGHTTFIKSAKIIKNQHEDVAFVVVGIGEKKTEDNLRQLIADLNLPRSVYFLGWRDDIDKIMQSADLLVSASEREGSSRVIIEAMASGKPIVSTICGGPEEIVVDGKTGFLVRVGDPRGMSNAIIKILKDPILATKFGKASRERAKEYFNERTYVRNIESVILKTFNGRQN